jgi:hypothetical protein
MTPIYSEVIQIKGRGGPQKRAELFEKRVSKIGGVWTDVHDKVEAAFDKLFCNQLKTLSKDLEEVVEVIHRKFNMLCADTEVKDESEKLQEEELRQNLQKSLIKARELVQGPIQDLAVECKNYSIRKEQTALFVPSD